MPVLRGVDGAEFEEENFELKLEIHELFRPPWVFRLLTGPFGAELLFSSLRLLVGGAGDVFASLCWESCRPVELLV